MYDFLCLFPHANASHSLIHYLNQHRLMHVAPYTSLFRSLDDICAYERNLRPAINVIGAATKDYHKPAIVKKFLEATKRDVIIQTIRDPVESFVTQTNNTWFVHRFAEIAEGPGTRAPIEELIVDAVTRFITPAAAEVAYEVDSFREHILIDVEDLKGDKTQGAVETLWLKLCGNADPENRMSNHYKPLGSRSFTKLREYGPLICNVAPGRKMQIHPVAEGDLMNGYFDAPNNLYGGREAVIRHYPDASTLVPALRLTGGLDMCAFPIDWYTLHPTLRSTLAPVIARLFEKRLAWLNEVFAEAEKAMDFTLNSMTPAQTEMLKVGIADDFSTFRRRHPAAAERWTVTRAFLGL